MVQLPASAAAAATGQHRRLVFRLLQVSSLVGVVALLVCAWQAEGTGYWLLGTAALFYAGLPYLTAQVYWMRHQRPARPASATLADFQILAWLFAVPGIVGTVIDLGRRFGEAAELAATQRATAKYGSGAVKQTAAQGRQRQVFLGRCWEGPFCRDNIRVKCPIYLQKARAVLVVQRGLHVRGADRAASHDHLRLEKAVHRGA